MKTKLLIVLTALMTLSLSACSQSNKSKDTKVMNKSKVLVAYFSASGVTRGVAQQLSEAAGADLHEIKPQQPYTDADLDWRDKQSRSTLEMQDKSSRPAITAKLQNMADYDVVFVGFPIRAGHPGVAGLPRGFIFLPRTARCSRNSRRSRSCGIRP